MIELITIFIPVAVLCKDMSVKNCEMIKYQGYFLSQAECNKHIQTSFFDKLKQSDLDRIHVDAWCLDLEIERIDKKYIPKPI